MLHRIVIGIMIVIALIALRCCCCLWWQQDQVRGQHKDRCTRAGGPDGARWHSHDQAT